MSPSNKHKISVASTEAAPTATEAAAPVEEHRYPVDDITVRSTCDILFQVRNKKIVVAYGMAEVPQEGETYGPAELVFSNVGCAKVFVDRVVEDWDDLDLEYPGLHGEHTLGNVVCSWIVCPRNS